MCHWSTFLWKFYIPLLKMSRQPIRWLLSLQHFWSILLCIWGPLCLILTSICNISIASGLLWVIFTWGDKWFLHWVTFLISIFLKKIKKYLWSSPSLNMSWTKVVLMILYCILYYLCLHGSSLTYISFPAKRKENPNSRSACMCNYFMVIKCPTNSGWYKPYKIENVETVR